MYKKILSIICIIAVFSTLITGCKKEPANNDNRLKIITTVFPPYDFAKQICGDKADVRMLLKPGTESHSYEPTPQDIIAISNADLFIYTGGENDTWVVNMLSSIEQSKVKTLKLTDAVTLVPEEIVVGMQTDEHDEHEEHGEHEAEGVEYDEHVWTSPKNAVLIAKAISDKVSEIDSANASFYSENTHSYIKKLNELDNKFTQIVNNSKRKTLVFGDRFPFRYLTDEYGLSYYAAFPGCAAEIEPSASTIAFLIQKVKEENIPVVFYIEFSNHKIADSVCEATGATPLELHSCHNLSAEDFSKGLTYIDIMQSNADKIETALQ